MTVREKQRLIIGDRMGDPEPRAQPALPSPAEESEGVSEVRRADRVRDIRLGRGKRDRRVDKLARKPIVKSKAEIQNHPFQGDVVLGVECPLCGIHPIDVVVQPERLEPGRHDVDHLKVLKPKFGSPLKFVFFRKIVRQVPLQGVFG